MIARASRTGFKCGSLAVPNNPEREMAVKALLLLGDTQRGDLGWVRVVLPIEGCVHGQFASEHQLPLPPVP